MNLETELLKANRRIVTARELLLIREFETNTELIKNDALKRLGMNKSIQEGHEIKEQANRLLAETHRFKQERVFHISQIEAICKKYYLRFLSSAYYKGTIDKDLPMKVTNFEAAYGVRCDQVNTYYPYQNIIRTHIMAPASSFNLQERPKDPLLFYQINEEYFYLIHKWGNDLSWLRGIKYAILQSWVTPFVLTFIVPSLWCVLGMPSGKGWVFSIIMSGIFFAILVIHTLIALEPPRIMRVNANEWRSKFIED